MAAGECKYFGTDGIRGRVGTAPITPDFMLRLGYAFGRVITTHNSHLHKKILIGKDTRISGYMLESALEAGLSAAGVDVYLLGPMPTPAIAYLTKTFQAAAGIVISASHNPHHDNGIKFFTNNGTKLPDALELAIEAQLDKAIVTVASEHLGRAFRIDDAAGRYIEFCKSTIVNFGVNDLQELHIVVDCAHGATYQVAPAVFSELNAKVTTFCNSPDGFNINEKCGATNVAALAQKVVQCKADLGIALDGDGDRVIMVTSDGTILNGDHLLYIIASWYKKIGKLQNKVVATVMSNMGLDVALAQLDIGLLRTKVGDRFVREALERENCNLGGESSGHIICLDAHNTGDGIIAALRVLTVMLATRSTLQQLIAPFEKFPQILLNVVVANKNTILQHIAVQQAIAAAEQVLGQSGRVLLRASGTENVLRIMVEGKDQILIETIANDIAKVVTSCA
ncbi:MAG: phosphoglucosamine mutase [Legionellales bacterium]|nr:MAG: phosphoglucosamine mutase [Legionellales bacterium]